MESGAKKVFAGAIEWPGWTRAGKTEEEALDALVRYGPRYKAALGSAARSLKPVAGVSELQIAARLEGGSGTDFGVPSAIGDFERAPIDEAALEPQIKLLRAAWDAFSAAADAARGKALAKGPRGGGRSLAKIRDHVAEADGAYISALGGKPPGGKTSWEEIQTAFVEALHAKVRGELPDVGPRGGERWLPRYAIRRSAWHALDHAWEIEDRT